MAISPSAEELEAALKESGIYQRLYGSRRRHPELVDELDAIARALQRALEIVDERSLEARPSPNP